MLLVLWLACGLTLAASPSRAADVTILINTNTKATTVYLRTSAAQVGPVFGLDPGSLWSAEEALDYGQLKARLDARAPELWPQLGIAAPGTPEVAPMGVVMHPAAQPVPFDTPFAASIAAAVCVTPTAPVAPLEALDLYAGFVLRGAGQGDLVWTMAETASAPVTVQITEFASGEPIGTREILVRPGAQLLLRSAEGPPSSGVPLPSALSALALMVLACWAWHRRRAPRAKTS
ncbi:hypothetical protein [Dinoroseobacter sp. S76]|uniref:hypothetical protein n=1 Tax=Dinoroseobacter sp. S76 TaxID=3415124 RepID=UPI003C7CE05A